MKRILVLLTVVSMLVFTGCSDEKGKEKKGSPAKESTQQSDSKKADTSKESANTTDDKSATDKASENADNSVIADGTDLTALIDEANSTDDPAKREELLGEIQEILEQVEGETITVQ